MNQGRHEWTLRFYLLSFIEGETCGHTLGLWNVMSPLCNSDWFTSIIHSPLHLDSNHANLTFSQKHHHDLTDILRSSFRLKKPHHRDKRHPSKSQLRCNARHPSDSHIMAGDGKEKGPAKTPKLKKNLKPKTKQPVRLYAKGVILGHFSCKKRAQLNWLDWREMWFCVVCVRFWSFFCHVFWWSVVLAEELCFCLCKS